jgi:ABC-type polysaccharide/polyol phosphate transport system ATPase subunit
MTVDGVEPAISVRGVAKRYCPDLRRSLRYGVADIAADLRIGAGPDRTLRPGEFWAVDDVSFDVMPGEALGIIGRNGAGKSTMLRMLAGITRPDRGEIRLRGRVGSLLSLGAGFNQTLTGRENILIESAALGITRSEAYERIEEIIAFSELDDFIDAPVHTYSDGMRMRLGFAVATSLDADILLLDEVLIVGDIKFRQKSVRHIQQFVANGGSIVFVSHEMWLVQSICSHALHLAHGCPVASGEVMGTINSYYQELDLATPASSVSSWREPAEDEPAPATSDESVPVVEEEPVEDETPTEPTAGQPVHAASDHDLTLVSAAITGPDGAAVTTGRPATVSIELAVQEPQEVSWGFLIWTPDRIACITAQGTDQDVPPLHLTPGNHTLTATIQHVPLMAGSFVLGIAVVDEVTRMPSVLHGFDDAGTLFAVETPTTTKSLMQKAAGPMLDLEVSWSDTTLAPSAPGS